MMRPVSELRDALVTRTNLARGTSYIVGRGRELKEISAQFEAGARLVTVTGSGGIGKSCVAMRFAEERMAWYVAPGAGGAWICELRGCCDSASLCAAVACVLGIPLRGERACEEHVGRVLARRGQILLVFDDVESLTDGARRTVERWLRSAPRVRILATSRAPLGIEGEVQYPLGPLGVPDVMMRGAELSAIDSVELFVVRARRACPELTVRPEDLLDIADMVRRLQGVPLAIELCAARATTRSFAESRERIGRLMQPGGAEDDGRAGLLRRVIADACAQLDEVAEACLLAGGVFAGGFTLAAVEAVLGMSDPAVLSAVVTLHGCGLVRATRIADFGGELRFSLSGTIHEYAVERLAARPGFAATLAERHAEFYAEAGRMLVRRAIVEGDGEPVAWLGHELENICAAHAFSLADRGPRGVSRALELALAADLVLARRGRAELRWRLLDQALRASGDSLDTGVVSGVLARGRASLELGRIQEARADFEAGLGLAHRAGSEQHKAAAHLRIGELAAIHGSTGEAREALTCARGHVFVADGPVARLCKAEVHVRLARVYRREARLEAAVCEIQSAIAVYRTTNQAEGLASALYEAAVMVMAQHRHGDALILLEEALEVARRVGARKLVGALLVTRGAHEEARGNFELALEHLVNAAELLQMVGDREREGAALHGLARVLGERGQHDDARRVVERALALCAVPGTVVVGGRAEPGDHVIPAAYIHSGHALRRVLAGVAQDDVDAPTPASLRIRAGGLAFRPPYALHDVRLQRHAHLRRILLALARERVAAPGERLAFDEVFAAGWPGERLREAGCADRVHVAMAALRTLGLRRFLVSGPTGYALTLLCPCELEESN